jgi:hypothetical protein
MNITKETDTHLNPVTSTADAKVLVYSGPGIGPVQNTYYWVLYKSTNGITREFVTTIHPFSIDRGANGIQYLLNWKDISATEFVNFRCADEEVLEKEVD